MILDTTEWKQKFDFEKNDGTGADGTLDLSQAKNLGEGENGTIYETETSYLCVPAKEGAKPVRMGKNICQRAIPARAGREDFHHRQDRSHPEIHFEKRPPLLRVFKIGRRQGRIRVRTPRREKTRREEKTARQGRGVILIGVILISPGGTSDISRG